MEQTPCSSPCCGAYPKYVKPLISPSVLNADLTRLHDEIARVAPVADMIHLDVMDNNFVPNLTFGMPVVEQIVSAAQLPADLHLMIDDADTWAPRYAATGAYSVTFHLEAARDPGETARAIRGEGARSSIGIKPATFLEQVDPYLPFIDMLLIMTVEPGFGGQSFMTDMLEKVTQARKRADDLGIDLWIEVDGGVGLDTIGACAEAGANVFVAGSAVYRSDEPAQIVDQLRTVASSHFRA
ncbi:MAG: ribulose-phosphate 3-epimerase [Actinomycetota bacterium]|jgi:ribulose-phosphate 3-epimerase